jgi:hypothetical protein
MNSPGGNLYLEVREQFRAGALLQEEAGEMPPEWLVQVIWQHQRIRRDALRTLGGQPVRVLHPGYRNHEAGPDFRGAILQIGQAAPYRGDVEVDLKGAGWRDHGHDRNPNFRQVVLHVIWDGPAGDTPGLPTLALRPWLDAPLADLETHLATENAEAWPADLRGRCAPEIQRMRPGQQQELLRLAGLARLESKAGHFHARARLSGGEQSLWEGLFRALGYKHNPWPMQTLAELRERLQAETSPAPHTVLHLQARLLGVSGLLPAELTRSASDTYVRQIWDIWWREQDQYADYRLPKTAWRLNGLRPANHPERRLALAAHWLQDRNLVTRLQDWLLQPVPTRELPASLLQVLQVARDDFWSWHWTLRSRRQASAQPLLGATRTTDLAMNIILPWFLARARQGGDARLVAEAERRYVQWPDAQENTVLKLAEHRLLGSAPGRHLREACQQQGLIHIVRDFCERSDTLCTGCRFPELVASLARRIQPEKRGPA